jgi:hypothetical protein
LKGDQTTKATGVRRLPNVTLAICNEPDYVRRFQSRFFFDKLDDSTTAAGAYATIIAFPYVKITAEKRAAALDSAGYTMR